MTQPTTRDPRVGLVLGAGGVLGGAWLTGALHALTEETGWDPGSADHILGTSAGSVIGALVAAGVPPWFMVAHSAGESFDGLNGPDGRPASEADRAAGGNFKFEMRNIPWARARCAWRSRRCPTRCGTRRPALAGWLPAGMVSTESIKDTVKRAVAGRWVEHQAFWAVACDYRTGKRVPFGRVDAPPPRSPTRWRPPAPSPASSGPCTSAGGPMWTAASAPLRASTCSRATGST